MNISSMDKMWLSFVAMALMIAASFLITFARTKTKGILRIALSLISFLLFLPILVLMLVSLL